MQERKRQDEGMARSKSLSPQALINKIKKELNKMTREEMENTIIARFGFEHDNTILFFRLSKDKDIDIYELRMLYYIIMDVADELEEEEEEW